MSDQNPEVPFELSAGALAPVGNDSLGVDTEGAHNGADGDNIVSSVEHMNMPDANLADMLYQAAKIVSCGEVSNNTHLLLQAAEAIQVEVYGAGLDVPNVNDDLAGVFKEGEGEEEDGSKEDTEEGIGSIIEALELPLAYSEDFISNDFGFDSVPGDGYSQSGNEISDAAKKSAEKSAAKSKGDLKAFVKFADKVRGEWSKKSRPGQVLIQGDDNHTRQLLRSVHQFIKWLKDNEPGKEHLEHATLKYKFTQHHKMDWVLKNASKFSSAAEIVRMLVLCSVVRSDRGAYGPRKEKNKGSKKRKHNEDAEE